MASHTLPAQQYCAYCGRIGLSLIAFTLLAEVCRKEKVPLKDPGSNYFHAPCARGALAHTRIA